MLKSSPKDLGANAKNKHEGQAYHLLRLHKPASKFNSLRQVILVRENPSSEQEAPRNSIYEPIILSKIPKRSKSIKDDLPPPYFKMKFEFDAISNCRIFEDDAPNEEVELEVEEDNKD